MSTDCFPVSVHLQLANLTDFYVTSHWENKELITLWAGVEQDYLRKDKSYQEPSPVFGSHHELYDTDVCSSQESHDTGV